MLLLSCLNCVVARRTNCIYNEYLEYQKEKHTCGIYSRCDSANNPLQEPGLRVRLARKVMLLLGRSGKREVYVGSLDMRVLGWHSLSDGDWREVRTTSSAS